MVKPKTESTAVNELINLVAARGPSAPAPADDLMFRAPDPAPLPRSRVPLGTQPNPMVSPRGSGPQHLAAPPPLSTAMRGSGPMPVPPAARPSLPPPHPSTAMFVAPPPVPSRASMELPLVPPRASMQHAVPPVPSRASIPLPSDPVAALYPPQAAQAWFEDTRTSGRIQPPLGESWVGTTEVSRHSSTRALVGKLVLPAIIMAVAGAGIGAYIVLRQRDAQRAPHAASTPASADKVVARAVTPATAEANADAMAVTPPNLATPPSTPSTVPANLAKPEPTHRPASATTFVDVRIDSQPSGATVTLIDRGKPMFLGTTPIKTAVDPTRTYDLVFEHAARTQTEHLDPRTTSHVAIALAKDEAAKKREDRKAARADRVKVEKAVAAPAPAPAPTGEGVLMIASKPPCEVFIDGKATGLMTPQRAIPLSAGSHKITLVSPDKKITKSVTVDIAADKPTKVIQGWGGE